MARPPKCRSICSMPRYTEFYVASDTDNGTVELSVDEYETFRLVNLEKKSQAECAVKMNVSRATVARIQECAAQKIADAIVNGKKLLIIGGDVEICRAPRPECKGEIHCCHITKTNGGMEG